MMLTVDKIQRRPSDPTSYATWKNDLQELLWHQVSNNNWKQAYPYTPDVRFQIAHDDAGIVVHFEVKEQHLRAAHIFPNSQVWTDSCVEFFLSLDGRQHYYNFELNVLGTCLVGYGTAEQAERKRLADDDVLSVTAYSHVVRSASENQWGLVFVIPKTIFRDQHINWSGLRAHANFYKCGDELPLPHFLSWQPIDHPTPNFHLPAFFGELLFR